jgi:hypothetical protein
MEKDLNILPTPKHDMEKNDFMEKAVLQICEEKKISRQELFRKLPWLRVGMEEKK